MELRTIFYHVAGGRVIFRVQRVVNKVRGKFRCILAGARRWGHAPSGLVRLIEADPGL